MCRLPVELQIFYIIYRKKSNVQLPQNISFRPATFLAHTRKTAGGKALRAGAYRTAPPAPFWGCMRGLQNTVQVQTAYMACAVWSRVFPKPTPPQGVFRCGGGHIQPAVWSRVEKVRDIKKLLTDSSWAEKDRYAQLNKTVNDICTVKHLTAKNILKNTYYFYKVCGIISEPNKAEYWNDVNLS